MDRLGRTFLLSLPMTETSSSRLQPLRPYGSPAPGSSHRRPFTIPQRQAHLRWRRCFSPASTAFSQHRTRSRRRRDCSQHAPHLPAATSSERTPPRGKSTAISRCAHSRRRGVLCLLSSRTCGGAARHRRQRPRCLSSKPLPTFAQTAHCLPACSLSPRGPEKTLCSTAQMGAQSHRRHCRC